mgnify:CR=1 FL=1
MTGKFEFRHPEISENWNKTQTEIQRRNGAPAPFH